MPTFIIVSLVAGILFALLDGILNANPLATKLYAVYQPIARTQFNFLAGILIDLLFGFILAGAFILLYPSLPGTAGLLKGLSYGALVWIFRVVMAAATQWIIFKLPTKTLLYMLVSGLAEMLVLGILFGLTLKA